MAATPTAVGTRRLRSRDRGRPAAGSGQNGESGDVAFVAVPAAVGPAKAGRPRRGADARKRGVLRRRSQRGASSSGKRTTARHPLWWVSGGSPARQHPCAGTRRLPALKYRASQVGSRRGAGFPWATAGGERAVRGRVGGGGRRRSRQRRGFRGCWRRRGDRRKWTGTLVGAARSIRPGSPGSAGRGRVLHRLGCRRQ